MTAPEQEPLKPLEPHPIEWGIHELCEKELAEVRSDRDEYAPLVKVGSERETKLLAEIEIKNQLLRGRESSLLETMKVRDEKDALLREQAEVIEELVRTGTDALELLTCSGPEMRCCYACDLKEALESARKVAE